jgi:hypothetical protein
LMAGSGCAQHPQAANPPVHIAQAGAQAQQSQQAQQSAGSLAPGSGASSAGGQAGQSQQQADVTPSAAVQQQAEAYAKLMQPLIEKQAREQQQSMQSDQWTGPATPPGQQASGLAGSQRSVVGQGTANPDAVASADEQANPSIAVLGTPRVAGQNTGAAGLRGGAANQGAESPERAVAMQQLTAPQQTTLAMGPGGAMTGGAMTGGEQASGLAGVGRAADPDELGTKLAQRVRDDPRDVANQLELQLHEMLLGQQVPKLDTLAPLPAEDREVVAAIVDALVNFRDGVRQDSNQPLSQKVRPLLDMAARVRSQGDLSIPTVALCSKVQTFGVYDPISSQFPVDHEHPVILYCEIENFTSTSDPKDPNHLYHTKLSQEVVLYTEQGQPVWSNKTATVDDASRRQRQDFFLAWLIHLPQSLGIGQYLLKVTVTDQQSNRVAEATMRITITTGAPPAEPVAGVADQANK